MGIIAQEVYPDECVFCLYDEIPVGGKPPFGVCTKHLDILCFSLDKAQIPNRIYEVRYEWDKN